MVLAIQVADCLPIFLIAPNVSAIGLVHAGWRGTVAGIAGEAVRKLKEDFGVDPGSLSCFIGPPFILAVIPWDGRLWINFKRIT